MKRAIPLLLWLSAGCLPGPGQLIDDANLELVVTRLEAGDTIDLEIAERESSVEVLEDGALSFFDRLPAGEHEIELVHQRGVVARCGEVEVEIGDEPIVVSIDVSALPVCSEGDAPRAFKRLTETAHVCEAEECDEIETRVDEDGTVRVEDDLSLEGALPAALFDEIVALSLSRDADRLFVGADPDCPPLAEEPDAGVQLERQTVEDSAGREVERTESIEVEGCGGAARALRDLLAEARTYATAEAVEVPEEP